MDHFTIHIYFTNQNFCSDNNFVNHTSYYHSNFLLKNNNFKHFLKIKTNCNLHNENKNNISNFLIPDDYNYHETIEKDIKINFLNKIIEFFFTKIENFIYINNIDKITFYNNLFFTSNLIVLIFCQMQFLLPGNSFQHLGVPI